MITFDRIAPNVHEITMDGVVEKADIQRLEEMLTPLLEEGSKLSLVIRAETWTDITGDALAEDMRFEFRMLPKLVRLARVAIVTDKQGIAALTRWIDPVIPMVRLAAFGSGDVQAARDWAAADPALSPAEDRSGLTLLEDGSGGVLAYEITGRLTPSDVDTVFTAFEAATKGDRRIDLMVVVKDWDGFQLSILNRTLMTRKFAALGKVRRYAVVGAPGWMEMAAQAMEPMLPIDIRTFDANAQREAREWLDTG